MNLLVVPKPVFNHDMVVEGYFFSYQFGNAILAEGFSNPLDGAMRSPFIELMNRVGLEAISQNKLVFIPVTTILLMTDLDRECQIEPDKIAFLLDNHVELSDMTLERVKRFHNLGYSIAFRDVNDLQLLEPYMRYTDYIFLKLPADRIRPTMLQLRNQARHIKLVLTDVESNIEFDRIKNSGVPLFDGPFYKVHLPTGAKQNALSPLKVNYIQLLNIVNQSDFDFKAFTSIVQQDPALAIEFMRLVNSASRVNSEIKNINQAAALLGQREIKKWISTAVSTALCADKPSEVTRVSLLRAKFCENMAKHFNMAILHDNLFLMGLMSILDVILELPMEEALEKVFLPELIRNALAHRRGDYSRVLDFVLQYEKGEWREISRLALLLNLSIDDIHEAYMDSFLWYSNLINISAKDNIV